MSSGTSLITFRAISTFMNELGEIFGKNQHSLKLYCRLINKTTIAHEAPIQKHIEAFRIFCTSNRDAILEKDNSKLNLTKISYSTRVYVDISRILKSADSETSTIIWKHLLLISALVDPAGKAKEILKNSSNGQESNFISNIIDKVEQNIDPNANPLEAVTSIMKSGVFNDLISGMNNGLEDGSLDLGKLMGTVSGMISNLGGQEGNKEGGNETMHMINTMMGSMMGGLKNTGNSTHQENTPNMPDIMSIMTTVLGGMGQPSQQEEESKKISLQVGKNNK